MYAETCSVRDGWAVKLLGVWFPTNVTFAANIVILSSVSRHIYLLKQLII